MSDVASATAAEAIIHATGVRKSYGATTALANASLTLRRGEVHALLGENGAGKSTLVKILVGAVEPDGGRVVYLGSEVRHASVSDAVSRGIVPIYQQATLAPALSVRENLAGFHIARGGGLRTARDADIDVRAERALASVGLTVPLTARVADLTLAERQLIEIARALLQDSQLLVLDEPTTSLNRSETDRLFGVIETIRSAGRGVLFISHRLDEVSELCDRITVLRNGATVIDGVPTAEVDTAAIIEAMLGQSVDDSPFESPVPGDVVLDVTRATKDGSFADVSMEVRRGEIVGIVGLLGSGASALAACLAGDGRLTRGRMAIEGDLVGGDRRAALRRGIAYVPADRDAEGLFRTLSVLHNATASSIGTIARYGVLSGTRERASVAATLAQLRVKPDDPRAPITALSGGNQQKVLVSRALASTATRILVAAEPTRGVDVGARRDIHGELVRAAHRGIGVIVASSDIDEIAAVATRVVVLRGGRLVANLPTSEGSKAILAHMTGVAA
jgi:ABC-type sugar transport system ATPase subunit